MTLALVRYRPHAGRSLPARLVALAKLEAQLQELEREFADAQAALREFQKRYQPAVGARYDELEVLREQVQRGWADVRLALAGEAVSDRSRPQASAAPPVKPFQPTHELRALFRELARRIHPDLAPDAAERRRRHELMAEATRSYRTGDLRRLQWLLEHWEAELQPANGEGDAEAARLERQTAWTRYRIRESNAALAALHASSLAEIRREAEQARAQGRNFIVEMRRRVLAELDEARREMAALESAIAELPAEAAVVIRRNLGLAAPSA